MWSRLAHRLPRPLPLALLRAGAHRTVDVATMTTAIPRGKTVATATTTATTAAGATRPAQHRQHQHQHQHQQHRQHQQQQHQQHRQQHQPRQQHPPSHQNQHQNQHQHTRQLPPQIQSRGPSSQWEDRRKWERDRPPPPRRESRDSRDDWDRPRRRTDRDKADGQSALRPWWETKSWSIKLTEPVPINELARTTNIGARDLHQAATRIGLQITSRNDPLDLDSCQLLLSEFNATVTIERKSWDLQQRPPIKPGDPGLVKRPPVVTVMGHVDHGKTTLLDSLRKTSVAAGEAGGITQHIGAFLVQLPSGNKITFLDTPGHVAFSNMRARGANMTDIVILVVAKDDGIMPQTVEAINHALAAKAPIIVAVNKCDKDIQQPTRIMDDLMKHGLQPEEFGGDVQVIEVSALKNLNLDVLEEAIIAQAELMDLKADPTGAVEGVVIESRTEKGTGNVATVLVQRGVLTPGAYMIAGTAWTRVRNLLNDKKEPLAQATPSMPVEVTGWRELPSAGDFVLQAPNEAIAREVAERRKVQMTEQKQTSMLAVVKSRDTRADTTRGEIRRLEEALKRHTITHEERQRLKELWYKYANDSSEGKEFPMIVKGDVSGTVEAIVAALAKLRNDAAHVRILHSAVGEVSESDVTLAAASGAMVVGFNVNVTGDAKHAAKTHNVEIQSYRIIYSLLDDVRKRLSKLLGTEVKVITLGEAEVLQIFSLSDGKAVIAGLRVRDGEMKKSLQFQVLRDGELLFTGKAASLKSFKKDVETVTKGNECGLSLMNFMDLKAGDTIKCIREDESDRVFEEAAAVSATSPAAATATM